MLPSKPLCQAFFFFRSWRPTISSPFQLQTPISIFEKNCIFKPNFLWFWLFSSWNTNCSRNLFPGPTFKPKKISSGDPTFENLGGTYLLLIFWVPPQAAAVYLFFFFCYFSSSMDKTNVPHLRDIDLTHFETGNISYTWCSLGDFRHFLKSLIGFIQEFQFKHLLSGLL